MHDVPLICALSEAKGMVKNMIDKDYEEYFRYWISGIKDEALFWDKLFESGGTCGGNAKVFKYRMNPQCPFQLKDDLEDVQSKIIDIGSGPYSRLGFCIDNQKLDITLVDPLAVIYRIIGEKYNVKFPIVVKTGMVELLHLLYKENEFDLVHMSNSLDHCFNPIIGILELLYITKIGGKVILRHSNNEAEHEKYRGFHQWNLTIEDGEFIIWRPNHSPIVVKDIIKDCAVIEYAGQSSEELFDDKWIYNKVVIRKFREFEVNNFQIDSILINLIEALNKECIDYYDRGIV